MPSPRREIERKYLLEEIPEAVPASRTSRIEQGYLVTEGAELRLRRIGDTCRMTVKGEGDLVRAEWETEIPEWVFEALWPRTEGARIVKERTEIEEDGRVLEVDVFADALEGLCLLEVELPSVEAAETFELPRWAGPAVDVTLDPAYKNRRLALEGRPEHDRGTS